MKNVTIFSILTMSFIVSVGSAQIRNRYIKTEIYEGIVFPMFNETEHKLEKDAYMPTNKEIAIMEKKIADSIGILFSNYVKNSAYKGYCNFQQNIKYYVRQYTGTKIKGEKEVLTAFFFQPGSEKWKEKLLFPGGRGPCNEFYIKYSITTGKFLSFFTDLSPI